MINNDKHFAMYYKSLCTAVILFVFILSGYCQVAVKNKPKDEKFPYSKGSLLFSKDNVKMEYVKNTEVRLDTIRVKNPTSFPVYLGKKPMANYLSCTIIPDTLLPGGEGIIIVGFDAAKKNDYGYCYESIFIPTNDTGTAEKFFFVMAYVEEDFSSLTKEDREKAPAIVFDNEQYDFGKIKSGTKIKYAYTFTNKGKSDLIIRRTKATCGCTATEPLKSVLKPGESSQINIVFDSSGLKGEQHKTVFVYCNDPRYSTAALHIKGTVE